MATTVHRSFMRQVILGLVAIGFLGAASEAQAQGFISAMVGIDFGGDAGCPDIYDCEDKKANISVGAGVLGRIIGVEGELAYAPDFFGEAPGFSSSVVTAMGNLMLAPKVGPVHPYVLVGVGLVKTRVELTAASLLTTDNSAFGWNVGGGVIGFVSGHFGLRADLRYFHAFQDSTVLGLTLDNTKLDYGRASAGIVLKF
jgi:opacity protein-like surface antigen